MHTNAGVRICNVLKVLEADIYTRKWQGGKGAVIRLTLYMQQMQAREVLSPAPKKGIFPEKWLEVDSTT